MDIHQGLVLVSTDANGDLILYKNEDGTISLVIGEDSPLARANISLTVDQAAELSDFLKCFVDGDDNADSE